REIVLMPRRARPASRAGRRVRFGRRTKRADAWGPLAATRLGAMAREDGGMRLDVPGIPAAPRSYRRAWALRETRGQGISPSTTRAEEVGRSRRAHRVRGPRRAARHPSADTPVPSDRRDDREVLHRAHHRCGPGRPRAERGDLHLPPPAEHPGAVTPRRAGARG